VVTDAHAILAAAPRPPRDPDLFSSNELFGEPGIYPGRSPMVPAGGEEPDESAAVAALSAIGVVDAAARMTDPALVRRAPQPGARAGLVALVGTVAEPLLDAFVAGQTPVDHVGIGIPAAPGRIVGPTADGRRGERVVNARYRGEHPALFAGSLAHDLLWHAPGTREGASQEGAGQYEEATLHTLCALVHLQLVARAPMLAHTGTELARRQNSLGITLLNSRRPGHADISIVAPDGPGTIPGGAPNMQTPDFWSIPFVGGPRRVAPAPPLLGVVLQHVVGTPDPLPDPLRYDDALGAWLSRRGVRGALSLDAQLRAAIALGLVDDAAPPDGLDASAR
jgi:hypothetical protein